MVNFPPKELYVLLKDYNIIKSQLYGTWNGNNKKQKSR